MPKIYEKFNKQYYLNLERTYLVREKEKTFHRVGRIVGRVVKTNVISVL